MKNKKNLKREEQALPWKGMLLVVALVFMTGLMYLAQGFGTYLTGSIVGQPSYLLDGYNCPQANFAFDVSPIPELFDYSKSDMDYNRRELQRINKKNHGLTSWYSYNKGFNESAKSQLIDTISYERNANQYLGKVYNSIKNDGSPHGGVDFVTKWLSPDDHNLKTVFPYSAGVVTDATWSSSGYGNYVSVCSDLVDSSGNKLRVLYSIAHLESISVEAGQTIGAGTELGKIGSTGSSTTPHAHISIMPDLVWVSNYKEVYNAGYKFYFSSNSAETLVKTIDPMSVLLNPDLAYSIVLDDARRQGVFSNASQYIAGLTNVVAMTGDTVLDAGGAMILQPEQLIFSSFEVSVADQAEIGESVEVTVKALDQNGALYEDFDNDINVVLSSTTAQYGGVDNLNNGQVSFKITDSMPGEVIVQVSNQGTISAEKKITFVDKLSFLEVTAPQKTTVGSKVAVVIRPIGSQGAVVYDAIQVAAKVFPTIAADQTLTVDSGRVEYQFLASEEGIYRLSFNADGVEEQIQITVEDPEADVVVADTSNTNEENNDEVVNDVVVSNPVDNTEDISSDGTNDISSDDDPVADDDTEVVITGDEEIVINEGDEYKIYDIYGETVLVFNDKDVEGEFPVQMTFNVPKSTETVSIFTGYNTKNFPDTGELKLTKYTPGQELVRYYPKYVPEETYKKIVAYRGDQVIAEQIFTWSPASLHVFTDVVEGVTDAEIYKAVKTLKDAGVVKGNPDGTYGVDSSINRAATATILIRAFYSDIDLDSLEIGTIDFSDVSSSSWYASAIWFAAQDEYQGQTKPVIIKGFEGKANPDGNVKIEEFVTMIMRLLEIPVTETTPWYEGYIAQAISLGLITEAERSLIDQPLDRGLVARIMVKALDLVENNADLLESMRASVVVDENDNSVAVEEAEELEVPTTTTASETVVLVDGANSVNNLQYVMDGGLLTLTWESDYPGPFMIYRENYPVGESEIFIGKANNKSFMDITARLGESYIYRVEYEGQAKTELIVNL